MELVSRIANVLLVARLADRAVVLRLEMESRRRHPPRDRTCRVALRYEGNY